ncbi:MAG: hypothetical protein P3X22_003355 [Thermoprotei archaeon]|nr:hypothetical protein [Thermoprotei archaeon]
MSSKGPVSRLAEAINRLEGELKRLHDETVSRSNELVKYGDEMQKELREDIRASLLDIVAGLRGEALKISEALRAEYSKKLEAELMRLDSKASSNFEKAVNAVVEEVKRMLREV